MARRGVAFVLVGILCPPTTWRSPFKVMAMDVFCGGTCLVLFNVDPGLNPH